MIIIKIQGGLGNQMFQYAFSIALRKRINALVKYDISAYESYKLHNGFELGDIFNIKLNISSNAENSKFISGNFNFFNKKLDLIEIEKGLLKKNYFFKHKSNYLIENTSSDFDSKISSCGDDCYIDGYFQSHKYFLDVEDEIKTIYRYPKVYDDKNLDILNQIIKNKAISIHIRRGDYTNKINEKIYGNCCNIEYYRRSVEYINHKIKNPIFFFFSDDIEWCKSKFYNLERKYFVNCNSGKTSFRDMQLISKCDHNIIANSSFSWWGAWLNNSSDKIVICPKNWFNQTRTSKDRCPSEWLRF